MVVKSRSKIDAMNDQADVIEAGQTAVIMQIIIMTVLANLAQKSAVKSRVQDAQPPEGTDAGHLTVDLKKIEGLPSRVEADLTIGLPDVDSGIGVTQTKPVTNKSSGMRHMNFTRKRSARSILRLRR